LNFGEAAANKKPNEKQSQGFPLSYLEPVHRAFESKQKTEKVPILRGVELFEIWLRFRLDLISFEIVGFARMKMHTNDCITLEIPSLPIKKSSAARGDGQPVTNGQGPA